MEHFEKLRIVQSLSGFTQENLARVLGVSFPTINSWMNRRSTPHKAKLEKIDALYAEWTGQIVVPDSSLQAKHEIIAAKRKNNKNVLRFISNRRDIYDQFVLSLTYNTNRIEGSTLTEPETAAILFQNVALPNKTMVEQLEVKNHQAALACLFQYLGTHSKIDEALILKLHGILLNGIQQDAGTYRTQGVRIVGANVPTANYKRVPTLMNDVICDLNITKKNTLRHVSEIHSRFEQIHPFSDGNGRIGRLLIHAMLLRKDYPPAVIKQVKKRFYMSYLNKSQIKNDFLELEEFMCDAVLEGYKIIEKNE